MEYRGIRYRGISMETGVWVYGNIWTPSSYSSSRVGYYIIPPVLHEGYIAEQIQLIEDGTLGEFTGLTDRNGTDIYSGDIVKVHVFTEILGENLGVIEGEDTIIAKIETSPMGVLLDGEPLFMYFDLKYHDLNEPFEVIGNVVENKELLNKRTDANNKEEYIDTEQEVKRDVNKQIQKEFEDDIIDIINTNSNIEEDPNKELNHREYLKRIINNSYETDYSIRRIAEILNDILENNLKGYADGYTNGFEDGYAEGTEDGRLL